MLIRQQLHIFIRANHRKQAGFAALLAAAETRAANEGATAIEAYPVALNTCLEYADWSFASVQRILPQASLPIGSGADPDLPYFFELPAGMVRLHEVGDADGTAGWRRDAEGLRCDTAGPLRIRFTAIVADETALPAHFQTAVALHLAALLAPRWMPTASKQDRIEARARDALAQAARQDARQASSQRYDGLPDTGDWVRSARR